MCIIQKLGIGPGDEARDKKRRDVQLKFAVHVLSLCPYMNHVCSPGVGYLRDKLLQLMQSRQSNGFPSVTLSVA